MLNTTPGRRRPKMAQSDGEVGHRGEGSGPGSLVGETGYADWFPGQEEAYSRIREWLASESRFMGVCAPTGSGKSLLAVLAAQGRRTVVLTATKGLQEQYGKAFNGMFDIRGQAAYQCKADPSVSVLWGTCHVGVWCPFRAGGCSYYDALETAKREPLVVTNYAYWLAQQQMDGLGRVDLLVCDEGHLAEGELIAHLECEFSLQELRRLQLPFPTGTTWESWQSWASITHRIAGATIQNIRTEATQADLQDSRLPSHSRAYRRLTDLNRKLERILASRGRWVWQHDPGTDSWTVGPVWSREYADLLWGGIPKVLVMSATLVPKSASTLGMPEDRAWVDMPSSYQSAKTPISHLETVRLNHRTTDVELRHWVARIDQIIDRRLDRKGIVNTTSYNRARLFLDTSRHTDILYSHGRESVSQTIARFKKATPPAVLVSPSVTSGWDFPGDECRYIVIGKIPYPDTSSAIAKARQEDDKNWSSFLAMQALVQASGRGTRSVDDWCEVLVVDDNWVWFWKRHNQFAPAWFAARVQPSQVTVPEPPILR